MLRRREAVVLQLCLGWLVILLTYLLTYSVPFLVGWNVKHGLSIALMIVPYVAGARYYSVYCQGRSSTFYVLGLLVHSISEKILIYFLSTFIYKINPLHVANVMKKISEGSVTRSGTDGMVSYYSNAVSFFSWGYVLGGLLFSILVIIFVVRMQRLKAEISA